MEIQKELEEIKYYNSLSLNERKMINYLIFNNIKRDLIPSIIQDLRSHILYKNDDYLFKIFKIKYKKKYMKFNNQMNYYKNNTFISNTYSSMKQ